MDQGAIIKERSHPSISGKPSQEVDGEKIISYGVSSYGYDVRCADEFKIFTNTFSSVVDPKKFDPKSFVDIKSNECIIPPNSFALARTIEYFKIHVQFNSLSRKINICKMWNHCKCNSLEPNGRGTSH